MKAFIFLFLLFYSFQIHSQNIERVEPPNWWVGMEEEELQLLIYGEDIVYLDAKIDFPGIKIKSTIRAENKNYLFLYLQIAKETEAGIFPIDFYRDGKKHYTHLYPLKEREKEARFVKGFDASDVLYLITPDRFANGNPNNDVVESMLEGRDRGSKIGRHGGDIKGISDRLDYLADMGFTAIWLNPVIENDMPKYSYHGYAATDFYKIDARFGSNEEYRNFCGLAKSKGLKIIMDMILNHCGSEHWFVKDPPFSDWINNQGKYIQTSHKRTTVQDIHASEYDKKAFSDGWFVETMPDLNQKNPLMADYLIYNTIWWIEYAGISGIRMDTYPYPDKEFMSDWTCAVMREYPQFNIVGEEWSLNPAIVSYWQKDKVNHDGYTSCLPSLMDFPLQDAFIKGLREKEAWNSGWIQCYEMLANDFLYADPDELVIFPDNHDMARFYTQIDNDLDLFKMGMVYFATMRGIPQFYYGTEILMHSNENPGDHGIIRSDFPGGWTGDKVNALSGEGLTKDQKEAREFTRKLLNWRKKKEVIHEGKLIQFSPEDGIYTYFRLNDEETVMLIFNKNANQKHISLDKFAEIISGKSTAYDVMKGESLILNNKLEIRGKSAMILEIPGKIK